eukprot:TRINITY_DN33369_c0_g1_i1.p1 TRINITY_DN33369_c0_g1~~TRINITY_DN33369_c0_g1_i1.p1  ORF type:complete len:1179 (+),score=278.54 TRINITY_DN33369_c0_g1_i1:83-3538(+)
MRDGASQNHLETQASDATHFEALASGELLRLPPGPRSEALLGASRHFVKTLPNDEVSSLRGMPTFALLEERGVSVEQMFGWYVLGAHTHAMRAAKELHGQDLPTAVSLLEMRQGREDQDEVEDEDDDDDDNAPDGEEDDEEQEEGVEEEDEELMDLADLEQDDDHGVGVNEVLDMFDENGDGLLSLAELKSVLKSLGHAISDEELRAKFDELDTDKSGHIDREEFRRLYEKMENPSDETLRRVFEIFDTDKSGTIDRHDLIALMRSFGSEFSAGSGTAAASADAMIAKADKDGNGKIDIDEFIAAQSKEDHKKWRTAALTIGATLDFSQLDDELARLEAGEASSSPRRILTVGSEAVAANMDPKVVNGRRMNAVLADYMRVLEDENDDGDNAWGRLRKPLSQTDPEMYRAARQRNRFRAPEWLRLQPEEDADKEAAARLYDRIFNLHMSINGWLQFVREKESVTWEDLQTQQWHVQLGNAIYNAVAPAVGSYLQMFKRGYKCLARLWVKMLATVTRLFKGCAQDAAAEEQEVLEETGLAGLDGSKEPAMLQDNLLKIEEALAKRGEGAEDMQQEVLEAVDQAKKDGEHLEQVSKRQESETELEASAQAAVNSEQSLINMHQKSCAAARKQSSWSLKKMVEKITSVSDDMLPDIGIRGIGGSLTVFGGGSEEVVDFRNKEIGYFAGKGIVLGSTAAGGTITGYVGLGWKNSKKEWPLDETYRTGLWVMGRTSVAMPLPFLPVIEGTASVGVGFKTDADDSAGIPWTPEPDGLKILTFGVSVGFAATGQGRQGTSVQYGGDNYRYITSECFDNLQEFQASIWKLWCSTCTSAKAQVRAQEVKSRTLVGLSAFRTAVHAASFPVLTDLVFTYLAWRNDVKMKRDGHAEACSAWSVQNRNNATKLQILTSHFAKVATKQLTLLKFHIKRLRDNLEAIAEEHGNGNLTELAKTRSILKRMQGASCRRFPFQGIVGSYLFEEQAEDYPERLRLSREELESKTDSELKEICEIFTFTCGRKYLGALGFTVERQTIIDRLSEAIKRRAATAEYDLGTCTKDKQCLMENTVCGDDATLAGGKRCMCKPGYCHRERKDGTSKCRQPKGKAMNKALNALQQWVRRTELRIGLVVRKLRKQTHSLQDAEMSPSRGKKGPTGRS